MKQLILALLMTLAPIAASATPTVVTTSNGGLSFDGWQTLQLTDLVNGVADAAAAAPVKSVNGLTGAVVMAFPQFIAGFTPASPGTVASLISTQPCSSTLRGQYAVVSDLFGGTNESMRCGSTGTFFYWQPVRANYAATTTATGGTVTLTPLVTAPTLIMSGSLTSALTIALSSTNAYCGEEFNISTTGIGINLLGVTLSGLLGGVTKALGLSGYQAVFACTSGTNGWQVFP